MYLSVLAWRLSGLHYEQPIAVNPIGSDEISAVLLKRLHRHTFMTKTHLMGLVFKKYFTNSFFYISGVLISRPRWRRISASKNAVKMSSAFSDGMCIAWHTRTHMKWLSIVCTRDKWSQWVSCQEDDYDRRSCSVCIQINHDSVTGQQLPFVLLPHILLTWHSRPSLPQPGDSRDTYWRVDRHSR